MKIIIYFLYLCATVKTYFSKIRKVFLIRLPFWDSVVTLNTVKQTEIKERQAYFRSGSSATVGRALWIIYRLPYSIRMYFFKMQMMFAWQSVISIRVRANADWTDLIFGNSVKVLTWIVLTLYINEEVILNVIVNTSVTNAVFTINVSDVWRLFWVSFLIDLSYATSWFDGSDDSEKLLFYCNIHVHTCIFGHPIIPICVFLFWFVFSGCVFCPLSCTYKTIKQTKQVGKKIQYHRDLHCTWAYCETVFLFKRKHSSLPSNTDKSSTKESVPDYTFKHWDQLNLIECVLESY